MRFLMVAVLALAVAFSPAFAAEQKIVPGANHDASGQIGQVADQAGTEFVQGARRVIEPFIVLGKTVIDGVTFVMLKGAQGVVYVAEDAIMGLKWVAKGAKFVIIKTAQGLKWVAVKALELGEIILDAACDAAILVIDTIEYVLIRVEDGVVYIAKTAIEVARKVGHIVINSVKYVIHKTIDGIVWVTENTWKAIKAGAAWTREQAIRASLRTRLAGALAAGDVSEPSLAYFQNYATRSDVTPSLRKLAAAAYEACKKFNEVYNTNK